MKSIPTIACIGIAFIGGFSGCQTKTETAARRAFLYRESLEEKMFLEVGCNPREGETFTDGGVACRKWLNEYKKNPHRDSDIRWANESKMLLTLPQSGNIIRVGMNKTIDSHDWVIQLTDIDGKVMSYWLDSGSDSGGNVRSMEPY